MFFWMALCAKLDDPHASFSWFVVLLPVWAFFLLAFALAILHGLASKNNRATRFEKILISALIPAGFAVSCVLLVLRLEGVLEVKFSQIFASELVSFVMIYIYSRYLKPKKVGPE